MGCSFEDCTNETDIIHYGERYESIFTCSKHEKQILIEIKQELITKLQEAHQKNFLLKDILNIRNEEISRLKILIVSLVEESTKEKEENEEANNDFNCSCDNDYNSIPEFRRGGVLRS